MLLSNRYQFLFVHIAKTGGTSMRAALKRLLWRDPLYYLQWPCHRLDHLSGHRIAAKLPRHCRAIAAQEMIPHEIYQQLFKFAFVRNPWDWQVSCFHHLLREKPEALRGIDRFDAYLEMKLDAKRPYANNLDTTRWPQIEHLTNLRGELIVDHIGRYESLQDDFNLICDRIGIARVTLPHHRKSARKSDYRQYYDDRTAERVARVYQRDIDTFGYRFDPPT
ncbi:MAG TPA: sulfotransferase family 2 domain-containing protein [Solimonas sp.]